MSRTQRFGIGLLLAAGTGVVLWSSCSGAKKEPAHAVTEAAATAPEPSLAATAVPPAADGARATAPGSGDSAAPQDSAAGSRTAPDADAGSAPDPRSGSSIARAVATSDPRDLAFLSRIEREFGKDPPPAVHALVERRKRGASREELTREARELPDLGLRVLALRWVDEVFGGAGTASPVATTPGSGAPLVKPLEPRR